MPRRIFISSVMRDFAPQRAAAKEAVIRLRQTPVMAEDFGAQPMSSHTACLEGVRTSEVYVGIFGNRYGYVAPSSKLAATEEEFREAHKHGLPILCFEQNGPKDPAQTEFLSRIKDYENGYAIVFFDSPEELKMLVVQAIHDLIDQPGITTLEPAAAANALSRYQWGSRRPDQSGTWIGSVLLPSRQGERFLDVLDFGKRTWQDRLVQPALFGLGAIFSTELGVQRSEAGDALILKQEGTYKQMVVSLEVYPEGTLVFGASLGRDRQDFRSLVSSFIVDEEESLRLLTAFLHYGSQFYQNLDRGDLITSLYFGTSLTGIDNRCFGKLPSASQTSISMPMHGLPNPLKVPEIPLRISRAELADPASLAQKMIEHISRVFRNVNAYSDPNSSGRRSSPW